MSPTQRIWILFAACLAWVPVSVSLGRIAAQDQDAAGKGIYAGITTLFLLVAGALSLGLPALRQAKKRIHFSTRLAAWLILLSPALVVGGVLLFEVLF